MGKTIYEYRIIEEIRDELGRRPDPTLEDLINEYGADGWSLVQTLGKNRVIMTRAVHNDDWVESKVAEFVSNRMLYLDGVVVSRDNNLLELDEDRVLHGEDALEYLARALIRSTL